MATLEKYLQFKPQEINFPDPSSFTIVNQSVRIKETRERTGVHQFGSQKKVTDDTEKSIFEKLQFTQKGMYIATKTVVLTRQRGWRSLVSHSVDQSLGDGHPLHAHRGQPSPESSLEPATYTNPTLWPGNSHPRSLPPWAQTHRHAATVTTLLNTHRPSQSPRRVHQGNHGKKKKLGVWSQCTWISLDHWESLTYGIRWVNTRTSDRTISKLPR